MVWVSFCITEIKIDKTMEEKTVEGRYERALENPDHLGND